MAETKTQPKEWEEGTLNDVAKVIGGYAFRGKDFGSEGSPVIKIKDIKPPYVEVQNAEKVDISSYNPEKIERYKLTKGDYLVAMTGATIGKVGRIVYGDVSYLNQRVAKVEAKENLANNDFVYYLICSKGFERYINAISSGSSAQQNISADDIGRFPVWYPINIKEQKEIAGVLSSLDDKIELLRKQNETLEQIARAIFHEWFVEFNFPNEKGLPYKASGGKMVKSELGEIPEGWGVITASDIADISIGRTPPRKESKWFSIEPTNKKWISIRDMGDAGIFINKTSEYLTEKAISQFNIPRIPENTVVVSFKLTVGRIAITTEEMLSNEAIAHFKQKDRNITPTEYIYLWLKNFDFSSLGSTSSIANATNSQTIKQIPFLITNKRSMNDFKEVVIPLFRKIRENTESIKTLSIIRDMLLPKLMSGEIRVNMKTN